MLNVTERYRFVYKPLVFIASLLPLAWLVSAAAGLSGQDLGPNPTKYLLHFCGKTALNFLMLTLLVTPLKNLAGWPQLVRLRRMLGLFAFFYVTLHFAIYIGLDQDFDLAGVTKDIVKRPYITIGFTGFLLLIPLAITSTNGMMRRLGRRWQKLHRLIYLSAVLGVWHYYWQVKRDVREPLLYAAGLTVLLGYRLVVRRRAAARLTSKSVSATIPERTSVPAPSPDS